MTKKSSDFMDTLPFLVEFERLFCGRALVDKSLMDRLLETYKTGKKLSNRHPIIRFFVALRENCAFARQEMFDRRVIQPFCAFIATVEELYGTKKPKKSVTSEELSDSTGNGAEKSSDEGDNGVAQSGDVRTGMEAVR